MSLNEQIKKAKDKYTDKILSYKGVVGIGIGYKTINGKETAQLSIVISVKKKKPLNELKENEIIPEELDGIKTDVREVGEIRAI